MQTAPFSDLPRSPASHFRLYLYGAALQFVRKAAQLAGSFDAAFDRFPFLAGYSNELASHGLEGMSPDDAPLWWRKSVMAWESGTTQHLPLRALRNASGLDYDAMLVLMSVGLIEEDGRFGDLFAALQSAPERDRPTISLLDAFWSDPEHTDDARVTIRHLIDLGLLQFVSRDGPGSEWTLQTHNLLWNAMRGETHEEIAPWARYRAPAMMAGLENLILPETLRDILSKMPPLLQSGEASAVVVRGYQHNGRRTLAGALAHMMGKGVIEITGLVRPDDERWRIVGPLATLLHGVPLVVLDLCPGENVELPRLAGYEGPSCIVLNRQGGISGPLVSRALTISLEMPDVNARQLHWTSALGPQEAEDIQAFSERLRLTGGNIRRVAGLALSYAALEGRSAVNWSDVRQASRAVNRQSLDTLAAPVNVTGDWNMLVVGSQTIAELNTLEHRCRFRERLHSLVGHAGTMHANPGVRAMLCGASGTGKTLAARLLASSLQMDMYRVDLSAVVNKYIGETEKNLNQIFSRAEELDVILLLDEGDALLTQRTSVQTSNDRYANLETNYLLQRLESFEGILLITTNAVDNIDSAFQRRMDVIIDFPLPEAAERWSIWQLHLPEGHSVDHPFLTEIASRCAFTGGQIRNAAIHAGLLALVDGGIVTSAHLEAAVQREYRKSGALCPLRRSSPIAAAGR